MKSVEKVEKELAKIQQKRDDIERQLSEAQNTLAARRRDMGKRLIDGAALDMLSAELADDERRVVVLQSALDEAITQLEAADAAVRELRRDELTRQANQKMADIEKGYKGVADTIAQMEALAGVMTHYANEVSAISSEIERNGGQTNGVQPFNEVFKMRSVAGMIGDTAARFKAAGYAG